MASLVLRISDALAADLAAEARRTNTTKSAVARRRLLAAGRDASATVGGGFALIADLIGTETGGLPDLSARVDHYLKKRGYGRDKPRR